ncbi:replication protein A 70 kDa DNA-binding subunit B-like isoform X2 [Vicia villosa]|uniref:replication protein A 70 kDa DNA-binding subunit B-like isoform X2 n=1 Tax=Vicia villosa TaxID=3911 RepID=UPI00273B482C|nr:replication protein A 70 kDa DNA-binding subunit B-like isoform X2 [Vicia villosa]
MMVNKFLLQLLSPLNSNNGTREERKKALLTSTVISLINKLALSHVSPILVCLLSSTSAFLPPHFSPNCHSSSSFHFPFFFESFCSAWLDRWRKLWTSNDSKELWKVAIRVVHKWKVVSNNKEHFEMIYQDKEGSDIHVVVPNTCMAAYNDKFEVDNTYTVSNFAVQPNNLVFKPSTHKFLVKFTGGTSVNDVNKHDIPPMQRTFTNFPDIMTGKFKKNVLIDVIGVIDAIGYQQTQSGGKKMQVNFVLRDAANNTMNCTLWEDYAKKFFKFHEENPTTSGPTVILLSYAKVKEQGQYPLSVTNTFHVTKLQINPDLPSVKDFVNGFSKEALRTVSSQLSSYSQ